MQTTRIIKNKKGVTLIELLIALIISALLIAGIYKTFIGQQKTYIVQEQVVDMQQNLRAGINKMIREIRMAGFGGLDYVLSLSGGVNGYSNIITPSGDNEITIVGGFKQIRRDNGEPIVVDSALGKTLTLNYATDEFDGEKHKYISIGGLESNKVLSRSKNVITLEKDLNLNFPSGTPIFKIQAITYNKTNDNVLRRDENTGGGAQPLAENIEDLRFEYFDANGNATTNPGNIRMVRVTITARTERSDPDYKSEEGIRRRTISSNIYVRNIESYQ
jgi:prepilin-type N-terminal cleavage/methylation domain-containing protein